MKLPSENVFALPPAVSVACSTLESWSVSEPTVSSVSVSAMFASRVATTVSVPPAPLKVYVPVPVFATKVTVSSPPPPVMVSAPANAGSSAFSGELVRPVPRFSVRW